MLNEKLTTKTHSLPKYADSYGNDLPNFLGNKNINKITKPPATRLHRLHSDTSDTIRNGGSQKTHHVFSLLLGAAPTIKTKKCQGKSRETNDMWTLHIPIG